MPEPTDAVFERPGRRRPEHELVLLAARVDQAPETVARTRSLLRRPLQWPEVLNTAGPHGMLPLLQRHLQTTAVNDVPAEIHCYLRRLCEANARRNFFLSSTLLAIVDLLTAYDIPVIAYKGPILGALAYPHPGLREYGDLDLLVHLHDVGRVSELLLKCGYERLLPRARARDRAFLRFHYEHVFQKPAENVPVEVHWRLVPRYLAYGLDLRGWWRRRKQIALYGKPVPTLSMPDLILAHCLHGAKEHWCRLAWVRDIAGLIEASRDFDWNEVLTQARRQGGERVVALGLRLAAELLGATLAGDLHARLRADREAGMLAAQVTSRLLDNPRQPPSAWSRYLFQLRARERTVDRIRSVIDFVLTPSLTEWTMVPQPWGALRYVIRPARLVWKTARRSA